MQIFLGSLRLADGSGARAIHRVDEKEYVVCVASHDEVPLDGDWAVTLSVDGDEEEVSLAEALLKAGAIAFDVRSALAPEARSGDTKMPLSQDSAIACEFAEAFQQFGGVRRRLISRRGANAVPGWGTVRGREEAGASWRGRFASPGC